MTCHVSGILYAPDETTLPETKVVVVPADGIVASDGGAIMPDILRFVTDNAGLLEMDLAPGRYHLYWIGAESKGRTPLSVPDEASANLPDLLFEADVPIRGSRGPGGKGWDRVYYDPVTDDLVFESDDYPELNYRTPALAGPRQAAQNWAEGNEPGGPGTDSAKGWAGEAESIKESLLSDITAEANTLAPGSPATATYDGQAKKLTLGIPEGQAGSIGNAVRWDQAQSLSSNEQAQARDNIGLDKVDNTPDDEKVVYGFQITDTRDVVSIPEDVDAQTGLFEFKRNNSVGNPPDPAHNSYSHVLTINGWKADGTGGWPTQISFGESLAFRKGNSKTTWGNWREVATLGKTVRKEGDTGIGGYTTEAQNDGTKSSGTYTPDPTDGNLRLIVNGGPFTLAAPTATGDYTMIVKVGNSGSAGAVTFTGFTNTDFGDDISTQEGAQFLLHITKIYDVTSLFIQALQ